MNIPALTGTCMTMCPLKEIKERIKCKEISIFEYPDLNNKDDSVLTKYAIKKYRRSSAGKRMPDIDSIRPPSVLLKTLKYMINTLLPYFFNQENKQSRHFQLNLYNFMDDRIRSIRQDFTYQMIENEILVEALEIIVRFYICFGSYLSFQNVDTFKNQINSLNEDWSLFLNDQQLISALGRLQELYRSLGKDVRTFNNKLEFQKYWILLGAVQNGGLSMNLRHLIVSLVAENEMRSLLHFCVAIKEVNYYHIWKYHENLTFLEKCIFHRHLFFIWQETMYIMNKSHIKNEAIPLENISKYFGLNSIKYILTLCQGFNVSVDTKSNHIRFKKNIINTECNSIEKHYTSYGYMEEYIFDRIHGTNEKRIIDMILHKIKYYT